MQDIEGRASIGRLQRVASERSSILGLGGGLPAPELFPRGALSRAFTAAVKRASTLQYGWPEGSPGLRAWIATRLRARGADVAPDDVIVTNGAQQALAIVMKLLVEKGAEVEVDPETYPAALDLVREREAHAVVAAGSPACTYVMPGVTNPRGRPLDPARRAALLSRDVPIVADEAYAELRFDGFLERPLLADARDRTWHVGTFSKTLCPGLRVGFLVPPRALRSDALRVKHASDLQAGSLAQAVLEEVLRDDDFDERLARARRFYAARADVLLSALRRRMPFLRVEEPIGGFSVFVEAERPGDELALLRRATEHGVSFDPGGLFRAHSSDAPLSMRLCFSAYGQRALCEAVERLARAFGDHARA